MNEHRTILTETVDRLFRGIATSPELAAPDCWREIDRLGLPGLLRPQEAGGIGGDWEDAGGIFKASGAHLLPFPLSETILAKSWMASLTTIEPEGIGSFSLFAPGGDSSRKTQYRSPDQPVDWLLAIDGQKWSLLDAGTDTDTAPHALSPKSNSANVIASGALSKEPDEYLQQAALMRACQLAGAIEAMVELSIGYVQARQQFGKPLAVFQAIQHQLAMAVEESAAASCATASACQAVALGDAEFEIAAAKWRASRAADTVFDIAHQVHGAMGFTREYDLHRYSLLSQKWRRHFGNEAFWMRRLGRLVLSNRPRPLWHMLTSRHDAILAAERARAAT